MSWSFTIPGQPPSVNNTYRITEQHRLKNDGTPYSFRTLSKRRAVLDYQESAGYVCRAAKPRGWKPDGFIVVEMELFLTRHIDSDNVIKAIFDAIQSAVGINDKWFLPCIKAVHPGQVPQEARVEVTIREA